MQEVTDLVTMALETHDVCRVSFWHSFMPIRVTGECSVSCNMSIGLCTQAQPRHPPPVCPFWLPDLGNLVLQGCAPQYNGCQLGQWAVTRGNCTSDTGARHSTGLLTSLHSTANARRRTATPADLSNSRTARGCAGSSQQTCSCHRAWGQI